MIADIDLDWTHFDELRRSGKKAKARRSLSKGRRKLRPPTSRDRLHAQQRRELAARREQAKRIIRSQGLHRGALGKSPKARPVYDTSDRGGMMSGLFAGQFSAGRYTDDIELGVFNEALHPRDWRGRFGKKGSGKPSAKVLSVAQERHVYELHRKAVDVKLARNAHKATDVTHGVHDDQGNLVGFTKEREALHRQIVDTVYRRQAKTAKAERKALFLGGLPGAGKTTGLGKLNNFDASHYITINPDIFKEELAKRGHVPKIPGLSPMEASALVHEESSAMALRLAARARRAGKNITWDITMASPGSVQKRIDPLKESGYKLNSVFVEIPHTTSAQRVRQRHLRGWRDSRADTTGQHLGERLVPSAHIAAAASETHSSKNREAFESLKSQFHNYVLLDNSGNEPKVIERKGRVTS